MHRTLGSVGAWLVATSLAVLVSWLGVQSVRFAAVPDRVSPMSASEARKLIPLSASPTPAPDARSSTSTSTPAPTNSNSPFPTGEATPNTDNGWTAEPDGKGGTALLRTVEVQGGSARLRFTKNEVKVLNTQPKSGFTAAFTSPTATTAIVTFSSPEHTSKITAFWQNVAKAQVTETPA